MNTMFELDTPTAVKMTDVIVLSQKDRAPDEKPGAKMKFDGELTNDALSMFDGLLKSFLFTKAGSGGKAAAQATLDGVPVVSDAPDLTGIGEHLPMLAWQQELTGYGLEVDLGLGGRRSNLSIADCKLNNWRLYPKRGGTTRVKFTCESPDVSKANFGELSALKSREVRIMLAPPVVGDDPQASLHDGGEKDKGPWPFRKNAKHEAPPQSVVTELTPKTKRGSKPNGSGASRGA